jgi:cell wall-associated NlpC family hydrolase
MLRRLVLFVLALAAVFACAAAGAGRDWAAPQIRAVTQAGVLGSSPATFAPQSALTQSALAGAIHATDAVQHVAAPAAPQQAPLALLSSVAPGAVVGGQVALEIQAPGHDVDHVSFALDGTGIHTEEQSPYVLDLDTTTLADGSHTIAVDAAVAGGGYAISVFTVTVSNAAPVAAGTSLVPLPLAKSWLPPAKAATPALAPHALYRAVSPAKPVTVKQLDAALVGYLGLGDAARKIQDTLRAAGLAPPGNTGTEAVARMLGLRLNHPAGEDDLELLPYQPATRAEAAYSFAQVLHTDDWAVQSVRAAADAFTLPELTPWQQRLLRTAIHYVGYPYVWGGTSPAAETLFGVRSAGGFDCSGFVWRVYKLTPYAGEGRLAGVLRGRTTYQMSGEVPRANLVPAVKLQPADVMFFGAHGRNSKPSEVDHTGLYLGNGWFVQSSGEGVTLLPFDGWYARSYAWGRRPLREAGLSG